MLVSGAVAVLEVLSEVLVLWRPRCLAVRKIFGFDPDDRNSARCSVFLLGVIRV